MESLAIFAWATWLLEDFTQIVLQLVVGFVKTFDSALLVSLFVSVSALVFAVFVSLHVLPAIKRLDNDVHHTHLDQLDNLGTRRDNGDDSTNLKFIRAK
jgi:hypothetical protein